MGAIKKIFIIVLSILIVHTIYYYLIRNINNPRFDLYYNSKSFKVSKLNYNYYIGVLPKSYEKEFHEETIKENKKYSLINILRVKHPNYHNYILLIDKGKEYVLKNSDSIYYYIQNKKNILSSQIDKIVFNKYLKLIHVKNEDEIVGEYCYLVSTIHDEFGKKFNQDSLSNYIIINDYQDYYKITKYIDSSLIKNSNSSEIFNPRNFDFKNSSRYCWFKNFGVFEMKFDIKKDSVSSIKDNFLGIIGAEKL